jgi:hypothetical protein
MIFYLKESSNKKKKVYLNVFGNEKRFSKSLVTGSLKQSVKNWDLREKNGLEKKQPTWKN